MEGLGLRHKNSLLPKKKPRGGVLSKCAKKFNVNLSKFRIKIEWVLGMLKRFAILSGVYGNRVRGLRFCFNLRCILYHKELDHCNNAA